MEMSAFSECFLSFFVFLFLFRLFVFFFFFFFFLQQEVQAAHWFHDQVTIHPSVTYYPCACGKMMTESLVFISSDLKHDYHAVHYFTTKALSHLRDVRGLVIDNVLSSTMDGWLCCPV